MDKGALLSAPGNRATVATGCAATDDFYHRLATVHNLHVYLDLARRARQAVLDDRYAEFARQTRDELGGASGPATIAD